MSKDLTEVSARGGKRARAGLRASLEGPRLDLLNMAGQPWDSPPPVSICISAGQRRSWVVPRVKAVLSGRHEGSNVQAVDGRSLIGSGEAPMTNADSHPSVQKPSTLQLIYHEAKRDHFFAGQPKRLSRVRKPCCLRLVRNATIFRYFLAYLPNILAQELRDREKK